MAAPDAGSNNHRSRFRRILVALESTSESLSAVEQVAALAERLEAEILGLFVEDIDLVRLSQHAEVRTFGTLSAGRRHIEGGALRRSLQIQRTRTRLAVEGISRRRRVKASFEVRRGRLETEVLASAAGVDLVIVGWGCGISTAPLSGRSARPSDVARAVAEGAPRSVLLLRPGTVLGGPALVAYDGSKSADAAIEAAADIADEDGGDVLVLLLTGRLDQAEAWRESIARRLSARGLRAHVVQVPEANAGDLSEAVRQLRPSIIVLGANQKLMRGKTGTELLNRVACSVLLVR